MEPDVAGGGGGEPGGLEPPRRKRAGSGRTPAPALWDHPAPALPWARGQAGRVRRNQRRLQAGLLALLQDRCITVVFELFVRACLPLPAPRGCLYFLFHTVFKDSLWHAASAPVERSSVGQFCAIRRMQRQAGHGVRVRVV